MEEMRVQMNSIHVALVGDKAMGIIGLVEQQKLDNAHREMVVRKLDKIDHSISDIQKEQDKASDERAEIKRIADVDRELMNERMRNIENVYVIFNSLPSVSKKALLILAGIITTGGVILSWGKEILEYIRN